MICYHNILTVLELFSYTVVLILSIYKLLYTLETTVSNGFHLKKALVGFCLVVVVLSSWNQAHTQHTPRTHTCAVV